MMSDTSDRLKRLEDTLNTLISWLCHSALRPDEVEELQEMLNHNEARDDT